MFDTMMNRISVPVQPVVKSKLDAEYSTHLEYGLEGIESEALVVMGPREPFTMMPITLDGVRSDEYLIEMKIFWSLSHCEGFPSLLVHFGI